MHEPHANGCFRTQRIRSFEPFKRQHQHGLKTFFSHQESIHVEIDSHARHLNFAPLPFTFLFCPLYLLCEIPLEY